MVDLAEDEINQIVMSHDGRAIAMADDSGTVQMFDVHAGGEVALRPSLHHQAHQNICTSVCFLPGGGSRVATGGLDSTVRLYDLSMQADGGGGGGTTSRHVQFQSKASSAQVTNPPLVHRVSAHPTQDRIAAALGDGCVAVLDVSEGGELELWAMLEEGHANSVAQTLWLPGGGGETLISGGNDERIVFWSLPGGSSHSYEHGSKVNWLAATRPGMLLVADQGNHVHLLDPARL